MGQFSGESEKVPLSPRSPDVWQTTRSPFDEEVTIVEIPGIVRAYMDAFRHAMSMHG